MNQSTRFWRILGLANKDAKGARDYGCVEEQIIRGTRNDLKRGKNSNVGIAVMETERFIPNYGT